MVRLFVAAPIPAFLAIAVPQPAHASDEEIQVYMDELNVRGQLGLDLHVNGVLEGDGTPGYPGAESALHRWRLTPEVSLGLGGGFELGGYLPLATVANDGVVRVQGVKARLKWLAPHKVTGFYWGANFEIGRVARRLDPNPWNSEFKLIGGWRNERWTVGANANFDFVVAGPQPTPAELEIATKLSYTLRPGLALGVENYNGVGALKSLGEFSGASHASFLALDAEFGKWEVNAAIGKGYGANADSTILKFVIGVPLR